LLPAVDIEDIRAALDKPLPGVAGQEKMAPRPSTTKNSRWLIPDDCREASVLVLLYPQANDRAELELYFVLTRRPDYLGAHSGQISLPGGRREAGETLEATAIREAMEEIGISPNRIKIVGQLSALYTPPSNFCIYPFVAFSDTRPDFEPDPREVAELVEVPLSLLLDPACHKEEIWHFEKYGEREVPFFDIFGHKVWGATAMILSEFLTLLKPILE
jgi:8-oxo-dGTP pyrophosphatase MutT (NUDIX family)